MCKSISDGGQRCAAHTRSNYEATAFGSAEWDEAAAAYASTPTGRKTLESERRAARLSEDTNRVVALDKALHRGTQQREVAAVVKSAVEQARTQQRAARDSAPEMDASAFNHRLTPEGSVLYNQAVAAGYTPHEAHRHAWLKYGYR